MRKTNRFVALLMALILVFSSAMSTAVFANEDVVGTDFEVTVGKLKAVGIMEGYPDGSFRPNGEITRAEFAKIAIVALGLGDAAEVSRGVTRFPDVVSTHWATGYINLAVNRGILVGYPNGTFQPEGKLTNAEAATILVRLVGLGPVVDKQGTWPANYIGRAANEGILKGVNVASSTNALRGLTAKMLLNTLEVPLWGADGYNNDGSVTYGKLAPETTLLENMLNIDVVEGRVLAIPRVDGSLEDDEITINDINAAGDDVTLVNKTAHSADHLFGLKVNAWVNDDDEIIYAEVKTSASDIIFDEVEKTTVALVGPPAVLATATLLVKDKTYDVATGADLVLNYDDATIAEINTEAGNNTVYGKVVLDKGKVVFAHLFSFDLVDAGLVTKVDKTVLTYRDVASKDEIDLDDYKDDEVVVMTAGFMAADADDIKENTVMYAFEDGDDLIVVLAPDKVVEGKLDRVREDDARVDGKTYNATNYTTTSKDSNDNFAAYLYTAASTLDLVGEDVTVVLDINGDLRHIVGDADSTSGKLYGLAVDAYAFGSKNVVEIYNAEGKKVAYNFEDKATSTGFVTAYNNYVGVEYELNKDGEIKKNSFKEVDTLGALLYHNYVKADDTTEFHKGRNRIEVDLLSDDTVNAVFYHDNDTVFMKSQGNDKEEVISWSKIAGTSAKISVVVVGEVGKTADFVWIYDDFSILADDDFYGVVTANSYYNGDDWITTVNVAGLGIKEYTYTDSSLKKGDIVSFKVSSSNELLDNSINAIADPYATVVATNVDGDFVTIAGTVYKLDSDVVVYATKAGGTELDKAVNKSQIKNNDVLAIIEEEGIIKVVVRVLP